MRLARMNNRVARGGRVWVTPEVAARARTAQLRKAKGLLSTSVFLLVSVIAFALFSGLSTEKTGATSNQQDKSPSTISYPSSGIFPIESGTEDD